MMQHAIEALIFRWSCLSGYCVVAPPRRGFGAHVFRPIVVRTHLVSNLFVSGRLPAAGFRRVFPRLLARNNSALKVGIRLRA